MDNSNIQDKPEDGFNSAIKWWERKRLWYNLITLVGGLLVVLLRGDVPNGISSYSDFYMILFWLFGANIFFTCGWGIEALSVYYLKTKYFGNGLRTLLFVLGSVFSFFWMFILTRSIQ
ncbi:hypothetical protein [Olleya sp. YS]|uniref:hypothetical protein n=1 Tax=Olleya sp. YS TaxID=3028318 RepID=UPI0024341968|nr:hypothetical protein [Olleya sp. YS]WGD33934.1 hypothetical protein Ollyesu_09095 [Olleya sp. YS]